jgi:hypothetical protein
MGREWRVVHDARYHDGAQDDDAATADDAEAGEAALGPLPEHGLRLRIVELERRVVRPVDLTEVGRGRPGAARAFSF